VYNTHIGSLFLKIKYYQPANTNSSIRQKILLIPMQMAGSGNPDAEMEDLELFSGRWCGHEAGGGGQPSAANAGAGADATSAGAPRAATGSGCPPPEGPGINNQVNDILNSPTVPSTVSSRVSYGAASSCTSGSSMTSEQDHGAFGRGYIQCKNARIEAATSLAVDCSTGRDMGKQINVPHEKVGNLNMAEDGLLSKTFRGSRVTSKGEVVNQAISISFDPATLLCTVCSKEHSIIPTDESELAIIVSDQNFVPGLSGKTSCVPVIRLEDPTLKELYEISAEILDRYTLPNGTLFLVGSTSHLCEMGSTIYSLDWIRMCKDFNNRWRHVKVGPLPPILREATPSTTTKVVTEIWTWFKYMYGNSISFPAAAWEKVIHALSDNTEQTLDLANREVYRVALPISLTSTALTHHKFAISSCLPHTNAFTGEATDELIHALLHQLSAKFGCNAHPEDILAREPAEQEGAMESETTGMIIIGGGSNCKRLAGLLKDRGVSVVDLTVPGWTPTTSNISKLLTEVKTLDPNGNSMFICDLMSNVTFCFEQVNGSLALPIKMGGTYHMFGKVTVSCRDSVQNVLEKLTPVFKAVPGLKIVLPPLPRYLHNPCCTSPGHCEEIGEAMYAPDLLEKTFALRKVMRDYLHARVSNVWVPDVLSELSGSGTCYTSQAENLRHFFASDGVHMSLDGANTYADLLKRIIDEKLSAPVTVSGGVKPKEFFWRGFVSPIGSSRPNNLSAVHQNKQHGGGKWRGPSAGARTGSSTGPRSGGRGGGGVIPLRPLSLAGATSNAQKRIT